MKLHSIKIGNFQRIGSEITLPLGPVTVLVGGNSSGKSSTLKAIHWAIRCATLKDQNNRVTLEQMDYVPSRDFLHLGNRLKLQNNYHGRKTNVRLINMKKSEMHIEIGSARNDAGIVAAIYNGYFSSFLSQEKPSTAYIPGLSGLSEEESISAVPVLHRKASSGEGGTALRQVLQLLGEKSTTIEFGYKRLTQLEKLVSKVVPDTRLWVKFDTLRDRYIDVKFLTRDMRVAGQRTDVSWKSIDMAGTGLLQVIQIFAYYLYFEPRLMLIDEPDAHLHQDRQRRLIKALEEMAAESENTQVLMSTHSQDLVRALSDETAIVWMEDGKVKASGNSVKQKMGWGTLSKDLLIFTEDGNIGMLDLLLSQWPSLYERCAIWPTFGKNNLPDGSALKRLRKKLGVRILVHRDSDFMSRSDRDLWRIKKQYDTCNIPTWFSRVSDMERCFLTEEYFCSVLDIQPQVFSEIIAEALATFLTDDVQAKFSDALLSAVSRLAQAERSNPITRWTQLGGLSMDTIKGKDLKPIVGKAVLSVLSRHGLGQKISNRGALFKVIPDHIELEDGLRDALVAELGAL